MDFLLIYTFWQLRSYNFMPRVIYARRRLQHVEFRNSQKRVFGRTLNRRPHHQVGVPGVGGLSGLGAEVADERRDEPGVRQDDGVVHGVVGPAEVLLRGADRARVLLAELRHGVGGDERLLLEVEDETHDLVLALAALLLAEDESFEDLDFLQIHKTCIFGSLWLFRFASKS